MSHTGYRLELYEEILDLIEQKRVEIGDPSLAESIESVIIESQVRDLEREILDTPGALEPWLAPRRRWSN
ncbi:MAG TPA: hypothetical protein VKB88_31865 [Bryobacteraceae bacterium]|nr:hypothetical protein [Bryobacteraceae bacterium]